MIPTIEQFADIHTHSRLGEDCITNLQLLSQPQTEYGKAWYSVGIHPWDTEQPILEEHWLWLEKFAADSRVVAIGECGLDNVRGAQLSEQENIFMRHIDLAGKCAKPLIIHCVGAWHRLLALSKQFSDSQRAIVHGFRGKPELAWQLLDAGFDLSFGLRYNADSFALTPPNRRFRETDVIN